MDSIIPPFKDAIYPKYLACYSDKVSQKVCDFYVKVYNHNDKEVYFETCYTSSYDQRYYHSNPKEVSVPIVVWMDWVAISDVKEVYKEELALIY